MERRLLEAARKGNINELNDLIRGNALILEEMVLEGAGQTPLHVACMAGHLNFVRELLKLMLKFAEKVNADGYSPLHIAAARGDVEIARELLTVGRHLCSVKGRERRIPLHYAVVNGELHVMNLLLSASSESIDETTAREETALHLAVKNNRFDAVVVLVEHLKQNKMEQVINWKDHKGNTALHLAAAGQNFEVVNFLLRKHALEVNASNESGSTPLDATTLSPRGAGDREIREILARAGAIHGRGRLNSPTSRPASADDYDDIEGGNSHQSDGNQSQMRLQSKNLNKEKESLGDIRNALLVVAALIVSATYQAVLQPPSFTLKAQNYIMKGFLASHAWAAPLCRELSYIIFMSCNTFGLLVSVQIIISLTRDLPVKLPLILSLTAMVQTYLCCMINHPFPSRHGELLPIKAELLGGLPLMISVLLLLIQRWLAKGLDFCLERLLRCSLLGGMYSLRT